MTGASVLRARGSGAVHGTYPAPSLPLVEGARYVLVPYVPGMVRSATRRALAFGSPAPLYCSLDPVDPYAYARLVLHLWERRATVVIVEHDIVPPIGAVRGLLDCERAWCVHPYLIGAQRYERGLGLAKISGRTMADHPDLVRRAVCRKRDGEIDVPWGSLDVYLGNALQRTIGLPHIHQPDAVHLHDYSTGGDV